LGEYNPGKADEYLSIINSIELDEVKVLDRWSSIGYDWMDGENSEFNYKQLMEQISGKESSETIHTMEGCYYEKLG
jgi:hypothetical protein